MDFGFWVRGASCLCACALVFGMSVVGGELPERVPAVKDGVRVEHEFKLRDGEKAEQRFKAIGAGVKSAQVKRAKDGHPFMWLPVTFGDGKVQRVVWDVDIKANWAPVSTVEFDVISGGLTNLSGLMLYVHSVHGWYTASFGLDLYGDWTHVVLERDDFGQEGKPESWEKIDRIRFSLWRRTNDRDGWLGVANVGVRKLRRSKIKVAVLRGDACNEHYGSTSKSFALYADSVYRTLGHCGIGTRMLSDRDVTYEALKRYRVVVLPHNTWMPQPMIAALRHFVSKGGKILGFFAMPQEINELLGLTFASPRARKPPEGVFGGFLATAQALPGQPRFAHQNSYFTYVPAEGCGRVLATWAYADGTDSKIPSLVLLPHGAYVSHVWIEGAQADRERLLEVVLNELMPLDQVRRQRNRLRTLGQQDNRGDWASLVSLVRDSGNGEARRCLEKAVALHRRASALLERGQWLEATPLVDRALEVAKKAFFLTRRSRRGERRLVWCHTSSGLAGKSWDESLSFLSACGFTDLLVNLCWSGCAYYNSKVLPVYGDYGKSGDRLKQCLSACGKHGVSCHVWKVCFNMGNHATPSYRSHMVKAGRVQVSRNGAVSHGQLCPTHPLNQREEIETMVELVRNYPEVVGVHFDYIRFTDGEACFCPGCRQRFEAYLGHGVSGWPFDWQDQALRQQWYAFRRAAINKVVCTVHRRVKALRPAVEISAAVYTEWDRDRDIVGQDVEHWCRKGWVDFVCPMNYRDYDITYRNLVEYQLKHCHGAVVYPGIGLTCWQEPNNAYRLVRQIELGRELGAKGFALFDYCPGALEPMKWLKVGCTKKR